MRRTLEIIVLTFVFLGCSLVGSVTADHFTVHLYNLNGSPLISDRTGRSSVLAFQQAGGSTVDVTSANVVVNAPKFATLLARGDDTDNDGRVDFKIDLPSGLNNRSVVIVARRFDEPNFTASLPFVVISQNNLENQVLHVAVPKAIIRATEPYYYSPSCFGLFRRSRCR